jgi:branched-chain amino acid transport system permease protein
MGGELTLKSFVVVIIGGLGSMVGPIIGLPVLRLRGHYFAIATLGVAEAMKALVQNLEITEGNSGI